MGCKEEVKMQLQNNLHCGNSKIEPSSAERIEEPFNQHLLFRHSIHGVVFCTNTARTRTVLVTKSEKLVLDNIFVRVTTQHKLGKFLSER